MTRLRVKPADYLVANTRQRMLFHHVTVWDKEHVFKSGPDHMQLIVDMD